MKNAGVPVTPAFLQASLLASSFALHRAEATFVLRRMRRPREHHGAPWLPAKRHRGHARGVRRSGLQQRRVLSGDFERSAFTYTRRQSSGALLRCTCAWSGARSLRFVTLVTPQPKHWSLGWNGRGVVRSTIET
jgi:hypothetical protein